jgi:hypothetical protein
VNSTSSSDIFSELDLGKLAFGADHAEMLRTKVSIVKIKDELALIYLIISNIRPTSMTECKEM